MTTTITCRARRCVIVEQYTEFHLHVPDYVKTPATIKGLADDYLREHATALPWETSTHSPLPDDSRLIPAHVSGMDQPQLDAAQHGAPHESLTQVMPKLTLPPSNRNPSNPSR